MIYAQKNVRQRSVALVVIGIMIGFGATFMVYRFFGAAPTLDHATLFIGSDETPFSVEVAQTRQARERGLMGRKVLCDRCGMLFVFPWRNIHSFWMKDTPLSLDILWIDNGKIVEIVEHATPMSTEIIIPSKDALHVLELPAGSVARYGIHVGDAVRVK